MIFRILFPIGQIEVCNLDFLLLRCQAVELISKLLGLRCCHVVKQLPNRQRAWFTLLLRCRAFGQSITNLVYVATTLLSGWPIGNEPGLLCYCILEQLSNQQWAWLMLLPCCQAVGRSAMILFCFTPALSSSWPISNGLGLCCYDVVKQLANQQRAWLTAVLISPQFIMIWPVLVFTSLIFVDNCWKCSICLSFVGFFGIMKMSEFVSVPKTFSTLFSLSFRSSG